MFLFLQHGEEARAILCKDTLFRFAPLLEHHLLENALVASLEWRNILMKFSRLGYKMIGASERSNLNVPTVMERSLCIYFSNDPVDVRTFTS